MTSDSKTLEDNAKTLLKNFPDAKRILKKADGKKRYQKIAEELEINEKIVSPALSLAKDMGFAEKIKPGVYKKITSRMKLIPNKKMEKKTKSTDSIIKKFTKKKYEIKIPKKAITFDYENRVNKMTLAYSWLFITENMLRDLIRDVLGKDVSNWWNSKVPNGVKTEVDKTILRSKYDDAPKKDNLEYTHIGQLKEIIISGSNWNSFKQSLKCQDKSTFEHELNRVIPQRNAIGHCIPLTGEDYKYAEMRLKAILKLLK